MGIQGEYNDDLDQDNITYSGFVTIEDMQLICSKYIRLLYNVPLPPSEDGAIAAEVGQVPISAAECAIYLHAVPWVARTESEKI